MKLSIYVFDDDVGAALEPFRELVKVPGSHVKQFQSDDINSEGELHFEFEISYLTLECVKVEATLSPYVLEDEIKSDLSSLTERYDLVLVDDNYPSAPTFGQDTILPLAMSKMPSDSTWLPVFCLYTKEWRDNQRRGKFGQQLERLRSEHKKHVTGIAKDSTSLLEVIRNVLLIKHATERTQLLEAVLETSGRDVPPASVRPVTGMIGSSAKMAGVYVEIRFKANIDSDVLIIGESGTGKELAARALHECSGRAKKTFVAINANSVPENLFEALMFGAKKGIYTDLKDNQKGLFEDAEGGTLFIDEVQCIPRALQIKLLRVLQERKFTPIGKSEQPMDIRIIYGTSLTPAALRESDVFDIGFVERINKLPIKIPPLSERDNDVLELAVHFIEQFRSKFPDDGGRKLSISAGAKSAMKKYNWPGNVRQLENFILEAMARAVMRTDYELSLADFSDIVGEVASIGMDLKSSHSACLQPLPTKADKGDIEKKINVVEAFVLSSSYKEKATLTDVGKYWCKTAGRGNYRSFGLHVSKHAKSYAVILLQHRDRLSENTLSIFRRSSNEIDSECKNWPVVK